MSKKLYYLRPLDIDDKPSLLKWNRDDEVRYLTGAVFPASSIEHGKWFEAKSLSSHDKMWMIVESENDSPIGAIGLKNLDFINRNAELYIYIGEKEYWGKGIGSKATDEIIEFASNSLNLHKVYLQVFGYNQRAINMYEKNGFIKEGQLIESIFRNGKYYDKIIMAKKIGV